MKYFEYRTFHMGDLESSVQSRLNELGMDGWELIAVSGGMLYLKRELKVKKTN